MATSQRTGVDFPASAQRTGCSVRAWQGLVWPQAKRADEETLKLSLIYLVGPSATGSILLTYHAPPPPLQACSPQGGKDMNVAPHWLDRHMQTEPGKAGHNTANDIVPNYC